MKTKVKKIWKQYGKWFLIIVFSLGIGILGEILYNAPIEKQDLYQYVAIDEVKMDNFHLVDGNTFVTKGGEASLTIPFEKQYVDKFRFSYQCSEPVAMTYELEVRTYPISDQRSEEITLEDVNNYVLKNTTVNIRKRADQIILKVPENTGELEISMLAIDNRGNYSPLRMAFTAICCFFIFCLFLIWGEKLAVQLEVVFLAVALSVGSITILAMPSHKIGFDEEIHFGRAYYLEETVKGEERIDIPLGVNELLTTTLSNWPYHLPQSEDEIKEENEVRNYRGDYLKKHEDVIWYDDVNYSFHLYSVCYVFQWLMIKIGLLLKLSFVTIYRMGRFANLILYTTLMFFAIRHMKKGKRILFVLALMPTAMMSGMTYSYDAWVNGFSFLGMSYLLEEWTDRERKISYKNTAVFILAFMLASMPKPIYIPLLFLAVLFPKSKFRSTKEMLCIKALILLGCLLLGSTFILPALVRPVSLGGDARGGDTSVAKQLAFIFSYPVQYAKLLLKSIGSTFLSYTVGEEGLGRMGHLVKTASPALTGMVLTYTVLTDCQKQEESGLMKLWEKVMIFLVCFGVLCFMWTALYLSFTPVGLNQINGVQGRYYLPVTVWILWALRSGKIRSSVKEAKDNAIITAAALVVLLPMIYSTILINVF